MAEVTRFDGNHMILSWYIYLKDGAKYTPAGGYSPSFLWENGDTIFTRARFDLVLTVRTEKLLFIEMHCNHKQCITRNYILQFNVRRSLQS